jgi:replicative DNA helicase
LDELRGSGDLEQDADNVLLIHSPETPDDPALKNLPDINEGIWERSINAMAVPFMVKVAKQRQGPTGQSWYLFKSSNMRFYDDRRN